jgi:hypothetical protein
MVQGIIDILNAKLQANGRIETRYCLAENRESGDGLSVPYTYGGKGEYRPVDIGNPSLSWWKLTDRPSYDTTVGKYTVSRRTATYPLRLVAMFKRLESTQDDTFTPSWFADDVSNLLTFDNGDLKTALKAIRTKSRVTSVDVDSTRIWKDEFSTPVKDLDYRYALVAFDISVEVEANLDCWENECDYDPDILHIFDFCDDGTFNRLTETQRDCLEARLCECADVTIEVNGTQVDTAATGTTYDLLIEDSAGNPVGTSANPSVIGDSTITINGSSLGAGGQILAQGSRDISVKQGGVLTGAWNGVEWEIPEAEFQIVLTISNHTPVFGDSITLEVTSPSATLTGAEWYVDGILVASGLSVSWSTDYLYGEFEVKCVATDGSIYVEETDTIEIVVRPYERPEDWLDIDSLVSSGDEKIVGLFAVFDSVSNYVAFRCQGNYTVDWGDGTVTNHTSNTTAEHSYSYASFSSSTDCSRGYRQAIITITPQVGQNLTTFNVNSYRHSAITWLYNEQWLDVKISGSNLSTIAMSSNTTKYFMMLEKFVYVGSTASTVYQGLISGNQSLRHLEIPPITGSYYGILQNCTNLEYFNHDFSGATTVRLAFSSSGLRYLNADLYNVGANGFISAFQQANSLLNCDLIAPVNTSYSSSFDRCYSLRKAVLTGGKPTSADRLFYSCSSLEIPPDGLDCTAITDANAMFSLCTALKRNLAGTFSVCTNMSAMYSDCRNIIEIEMFDMSACQNASTMFAFCYGLKIVPTLDTSSVTNTYAMFAYCYSLVEVGNFDFSSVTRWGQPNSGAFFSCLSLTELPTLDCSGTSTDAYGLFRAFQNMVSLRKLNLSNTGAITGWREFCRGNFALQEIGPCDMGAATELSLAFNACYNLRRMQGTGIKVTVSFQGCALDATAIDEIFTNLAVVVGQTITVSQTPGAATCNTAIATGKGWTVVT